MRKAKMRFLDLGIGMIRYSIAFGALYPICRSFDGDLFVEGERGHGIWPRLLVLLDNDIIGSRHGG